MNRYLALLLLWSQVSYGYDKDLCDDQSYLIGPGVGAGFISSVQLSSSFGKCSLTRDSKIEKIVSYILANREQFKNDFARHSSEVIGPFIQICACNEPGQNYLKKYLLDTLKEQILSEITQKNLKKYLLNEFRSDKTLYYGCIVYEP